MDYTTIGKNLRKYRLERNLKQEQLAELVDLSPNYYGAIERGEKIPSLEEGRASWQTEKWTAASDFGVRPERTDDGICVTQFDKKDQ